VDLVQGIRPRALHEPLIGIEVFEQVQVLQHARGSADERSPRRTPRGYALRGIVRCTACGRKMPGSCNNGKPHYRCNFLSQYAAKNKVNHPNYSANASCSPDQAK
jgi:site-specific DNA recombinase